MGLLKTKTEKKAEKEQALIDALPENEKALFDTTKTIQERRAIYKQNMGKILNPREEFDPKTFDPHDDGTELYQIKKRGRKEMPKRLPHNNMHPKEILEGQLVGMFESKQDLYLMIAWLSERVSDLEEQVITLGESIKK
jgi:hypothetical protein